METRQIGPLTVGAIGLGCMGMSEFYGPTNEAENARTIDRAFALGITLLDTADMYGSGENEALLGRLLAGRRAQAVIATKFGIERDPANPASRNLNGRPDYVRSACDASLARLRVETIDLYYAHRLDPKVPVEDTVGAMAGLVQAGKVRALGLSEVTLEQLQRARSVHPIAAVQSELSLWSRDQMPMVETCRDAGMCFVAYSPLGRGLLARGVQAEADLAEDDFRRTLPRFQGGNLAHNAALAARLDAVARARGATAAQLALAWLLAQGRHVVPIPGTRRAARVEENAAAGDITLTAAEVAELDRIASVEAVAGTRYPEWVLARMAAPEG